MSIPFKEIEKETKRILKEFEIETSSDFVCAAYTINSRFCPKFSNRIEPVLKLEIDNLSTHWISNILYSARKAEGATSAQWANYADAYRAGLDFLLLNDDVSDVFPMDSTDPIGWQIYRELDEKYKLCLSSSKRMEYVESKRYF